jgi:glycosyltransferase involved in cell wall biosynthesis
MREGRVAVVLKGYPRLSETFIAAELLGLERAGMRLHLFSMRHPTDKDVHPVHREISAPVRYLPEYLHDEPLRVLKGLARAVFTPGFTSALGAWLKDLRHDVSRNRFRRFGQAAVLVAELPRDITHLHAHFIHTPASVTHYASLMTGLPWTCSAHAKDIWTSRDRELAVKLADARWVVTCTRVGFDRLQALSPAPETVHLSYHGLDLERFASPGERQPGRDGSKSDDPVRLLTVCRAVEKKGLDTLLEALAGLPADLHWTWSHIGGGTLIDKLQKRAEDLGIGDRINWLGALPQTRVLEAYRTSDVFVLPCRIAPDGDRDGLPNVIVEAQSQGLCCLSTVVSGVPELIDDGVNGVLVSPDNSRELTAALDDIIRSPDLRRQMGSRGEARVREDFSMNVSIDYLKHLFDGVMPQTDLAS